LLLSGGEVAALGLRDACLIGDLTFYFYEIPIFDGDLPSGFGTRFAIRLAAWKPLGFSFAPDLESPKLMIFFWCPPAGLDETATIC
jgi:hypothetical protein